MKKITNIIRVSWRRALFVLVGALAILYGIYYATTYREGLRIDGKIVLLVEEETIKSTGMDVCIINVNREACTFGSEYRIDRKTSAGWESLPYKGDAVWNLFAHGLLKGQDRTYSIDWSRQYGSLEPGTYRLVKEFDLGAYGVEFVIQ